MWDLIIIIVLSYMAGSFPTGVISGKIFKGGIDIREHGSGNTGATNSFRILGWKLGMLVAFIDIFKGFAAAYWVTRISIFNDPNSTSVLFICSTFAVVLGHIYPLFSGFRGGRGFGTAVGAVTSYIPLVAPFCFVVFLITLGFTGYVSICAITASLSLPLFYYMICLIQGTSPEISILIFFIGIFFITIYGVRKKLKLFIKGEAEVFDKVRIFRIKRSKEDV